MISSTSKKTAKAHSNGTLPSGANLTCEQCGGNGYMKTTPSCYHTCLECLGRGLAIATKR